MREIKEYLEDLIGRFNQLKKSLNPSLLQKDISHLTKEMAEADFWWREEAAAKVRALDSKQKILAQIEDIDAALDRMALHLKSEKFTHKDQKSLQALKKVEKQLDSLEEIALFSGPYDLLPAYLILHSGTGGVDAADFAEMMLNMYLKFAKRKGWKTEILRIAPAAEAGIKSATIRVEGDRVYGLLKAEAGVHRLIRLSPFNAQNLRQTSFVLVEVVPEFLLAKVKLEEKELKVETFRASSHGGQSVNTTDSAVRITHLPTGVSAAVQSERSQKQNKERALKILASRLAQRRQEEKISKERSLKSSTQAGDFGHQIRTYTLHPYRQVKDHRSGFETSQVKRILEEGDLEEMMLSVLTQKKNP